MYLPEASEHIFEHGSPIKTKEPVAVFLWQLMLCSPVEQLGYPDESDVRTMLHSHSNLVKIGDAMLKCNVDKIGAFVEIKEPDHVFVVDLEQRFELPKH